MFLSARYLLLNINNSIQQRQRHCSLKVLRYKYLNAGQIFHKILSKSEAKSQCQKLTLIANKSSNLTPTSFVPTLSYKSYERLLYAHLHVGTQTSVKIAPLWHQGPKWRLVERHMDQVHAKINMGTMNKSVECLPYK